MDIKNIIALITGGGSGLGEATAQKLKASGAQVAIIDINENILNRVATNLGVLGILTDVTSSQEVKSAINKIKE